MILTKKEILKEITRKNIVISPLNQKNIGPASIDLTVSNEFRIFRKTKNILLSEKSSAEEYTLLKKQKSITLQPGEFILAKTKEKVSLSPQLCAFLSGRSRFARFGLLIDVTAFFLNPGISNHQVFEIKNISNNPITISQGLKIAQMIIVRTEGNAKYNGRFKHQ